MQHHQIGRSLGALAFSVATLVACDQVGDLTAEAEQALSGASSTSSSSSAASSSSAHPGMCAPPVADGVDLGMGAPPEGAPPEGAPPEGAPPDGGPGGHGGHGDGGPGGGGGALAFLYDDDESHDLDDTEKAKLDADLASGCTARNTQMLSDYDADDSGDLSQTEWDAAKAALDAARDAAHAALDTDGDGSVSDAERQAAADEFLATWDSDGDGTLNADERATFRSAMQALVRAGQPLPFMPPPPPQNDVSGDNSNDAP